MKQTPTFFAKMNLGGGLRYYPKLSPFTKRHALNQDWKWKVTKAGVMVAWEM
jgi:hypothetical protein